ncbi:MAG: endonuclease/exonuclease/phosphatase family protein [Planctomycetaceae bacterium]|nr:endonuclease/exonuclease/phosphatase family protein [Planctomycetaceae bacterium]
MPNLPSPRSALPLPLRIATYNINWGNARIEEVVSAIQQSDADIVCLQETNAQSAATLRQVFSRQYPTIRFFGSVERYAAAGFGLLSRIPLRSEKFLPAEDGLFGACLVELDTGDPAAQILNVHLQPVIFDRPRDEVGLVHVRDAFLNAERIHLREIKHLLTHIDPDSPSLILGDFNSLSSFQAPSFLRDRGYLDSFAGTVNGPDAHPTWHWSTRLGDVSFRIDYIFHSPDWRTTDSQVIRTSGSDHFLLVSSLELVAVGDAH